MSFTDNWDTFTGKKDPSPVNGDATGNAGTINTDYLIVGTGPAGGALACFLASHGLSGLILSQYSSTANTPRAHIFNMAALDCLRDIGLDTACYKVGCSAEESMTHTRWMYSMAGAEHCRIYSWGQDPSRKGEYDAASPSKPIDLPQTLLEPILMQYATEPGRFKIRWDCKFLSFEQKDNYVLITAEDKLTGSRFSITTKYLFGADGARSQIVKQLQLPMAEREPHGWAVNVLVSADLKHLMEHRVGNLHWVMQHDTESPDFALLACLRMIKPWHEWMVIMFPKPGTPKPTNPDKAMYLQRAKDFIGDDSVDVKLLGISYYDINESYAEKDLSKGNIYCLGDAVHRHPPNHGLGSNTCIQDSFNLAWKIALVSKGLAGKALLDTYSAERQSVGQAVVTRTNQSFHSHFDIWEALGILGKTKDERIRMLAELSEASSAGEGRRQRLQASLKELEHEEHGLGLEMNQRYSSSATYAKDEDGPMPPFTKDPVLFYEPSTYPGCRLPHAWLNKLTPTKPKSTIDLAGHGAFCLLIGIGGEGWRAAAKAVTSELGVQINVHSIGYRQDWEDPYYEWKSIRGVDESGCVLIRPNYFLAWRQKTSAGVDKLRTVMRSILSL